MKTTYVRPEVAVRRLDMPTHTLLTASMGGETITQSKEAPEVETVDPVSNDGIVYEHYDAWGDAKKHGFFNEEW